MHKHVHAYRYHTSSSDQKPLTYEDGVCLNNFILGLENEIGRFVKI